MKETFYFPHDYNSSQDHKIIQLLSKCGLAGIGAYWIIIEILHQQPENKIPKEAFLSHIKMYYEMKSNGTNDYDNICSTLVETGLLKEIDGFIFSDRVNKNREHREMISELRSRAGKSSANKRVRTRVEHLSKHAATNVQQYKGKERKGKDNKDVSNDFLSSLKTNPAYSHISLDIELSKMDAWLLANPGRKKTKRFIVGWLNRIEKSFDIKPQFKRP